MKFFLKICPHVFAIVFFLGIILLQNKSLSAVPLQSPGIYLPKPGEMVLASEKDIPEHIWVAKQYLRAGKFKNVISICEQVLGLKANQIDARVYMAAAYKGMGDAEKFKKQAEVIKKQAPDSPALSLALAQTYLSMKDFKNAENSYKKGLKTASEKTELRMGLAALYAQKGRLKEASAQYLEALKTKNIADKDFLNANFALCRIGLEQKDYDGVIKRAGMVTDLYPPIPRGYLFLANANLAKGKTDQAIEVYKKLMGANSKSPVPYHELSLIYSEKLSDYESAIRYAKDAVQKFPKDAKSQDVLGWVFYNKGKYSEAIKGFQDAVQLAPNNAQYHYHLGLAHQKMGKKINAGEAFNQALNLLDPNASKEFAEEIRSKIHQCR